MKHFRFLLVDFSNENGDFQPSREGYEAFQNHCVVSLREVCYLYTP